MSEISYQKGEGGLPLSAIPMAEVLEHAAREFGQQDAIVSLRQGKSISFADLRDAARTAAVALTAHGIGRGDRVGVWSTNRIEWVVLQFAVARIGAILVHVNPAYREAELAYTVAHAGCKALFLAPKFRTFDCLESALRVREANPQLQLIVHFSEEELAGAMRWHTFVGGRYTVDPVAVERLAALVQADDPVSIQYTSGTTGKPKGATLTHANLVNNGAQVGARLRLTPSDRICLPVPLFHCFGMVIGVLGAFAHGATLVFPGEGFDAVECLDAIESQRCTAFYGVPMMFIAMLNHPDFQSERVRTLRTGLMGGAPCPAEVMRDAMEKMHMRELSVVYGMTETSPISMQSLPEDSIEQRVHSVGRVHPHAEVKIVNVSTGAIVPRGERGEFCIRGYLVMRGYWNNPDATRDAIDADGWMHSGDLATMREDGCVAIVGRIKDMLIRGGENIFPREIEEFLHQIPAVADAQVFGVPDAIYGEQVCAWIRLRPGMTLDEEGLRSACKGRIASYKIPHYIRFVTEFPSTASGKVQKFRMREIEVRERQLEAGGQLS